MVRARRPLKLEAGGAVEVDETDLRLLHLLSQDGRASYASLARQVDLSDGAVRQRVERIFQRGVAVPVTFLDHERLPQLAITWFGLRARPGRMEEVLKALADMEEVAYLVLCTGRFHMLGEIRADSLEEALRVVSEQVAALPVETLESFPALDQMKENFTWVPPVEGAGPVSV